MEPSDEGTPNAMAAPTLKRGLNGLQFFTLAFGSIVGSAWIVLLGDWFAVVPPGGAIVGFSLGALVMCGIAACYAEMTARLPIAGGEMIYALRVMGPFPAFIVGWFAALYLIGVMAFEAIALGLLATDLLPGLKGPALYSIAGEPVSAGPLSLGLGGGLIICLINVRGVKTAAGFQTACTFAFIGLTAIAMSAGVAGGRFENLEPLFQPVDHRSWLRGAAWIFATCPLWLNGFQAAVQAVEERRADVSLAGVGRSIITAVLAAAVFYVCLIISFGMVMPWAELAGKPAAATFAMNALDPQRRLSTLVLVGAIVSLAKTWNGVTLTAARLIMAQARLTFLPSVLACIHPRLRTPYIAIFAVTGTSLIVVSMGRAAILPILSTLSISATLTLVMTNVELLLLRRREGSASPYTAPFGWATPVLSGAGALVMAAYVILNPWLAAKGHFPLEWGLLCAWLGTGALAWSWRARRHVAPTLA